MKARLFGIIAAMAALMAAGLTTGTRVYYALLLLLGLMVLYSLISALWLVLGVRVTLKGEGWTLQGKTHKRDGDDALSRRAPTLTRGEKLTTIINVRNYSPLPAGSLRLTLNVPGGMGGQQSLQLKLPPLARRSFRNVIRCPHRGDYELCVTRITAGDPFGLFEFSRRSGMEPLRVEVCPRPMSTQPLVLKATDTGPEFLSSATEDTASPSDIRAWREGDELKKVHWKLTLRRRELMVRTFEESARPDTLVIPDLGELMALDDEKLSFEDAICEAALGAVKAQLEADFPARLTLQNTRPAELAGRAPNELPGFTEALTRAVFDCPYPYERVLMLVFQRMQRTGGAVLVTARLSTRTVDVALRMQQQGIQVKFIWVSDAPSEEALYLLERLKMAGAQAERVDPWAMDAPPQSARPAASDRGVDDVFEI